MKNAASQIPLPDAIGTPDHVYAYVLDVLRRRGVQRILDCPAGRGAFTARLIHHGYKVAACDIAPQQWELGNQVECKYADMNERLPFDDGSFDAAVCLNGMHRIWARGRALGEIARVLRAGGILVLTNVNNVNLVHRLAFLACGSANHNTVGPPHGFFPHAETPSAHYRSPLSIASVASIGAAAGLAVDSVSAVNLSVRSLVLAPIAVLVWGLAFCLPAQFHAHCHIKSSNGMAGLFADYTAIVLQKTNLKRNAPLVT